MHRLYLLIQEIVFDSIVYYGKNKMAVGKGSLTFSKSAGVVGNNNSILGKSRATFGNNRLTVANNPHTFGKTTSSVPNNRRVVAKNNHSLGNNSSILPNSGLILPNNSHIVAKNTCVFSNNTHVFINNSLVYGQKRTTYIFTSFSLSIPIHTTAKICVVLLLPKRIPTTHTYKLNINNKREVTDVSLSK
jgi:hypothetical protein